MYVLKYTDTVTHVTNAVPVMESAMLVRNGVSL